MAMRRFFVGVILLLMSSLVVGCGIPQDQYDAVVSDVSVAQQELQSVKTELAAAQGKISELTSKLQKAETEAEAAQAELKTTQAKLETAQSDLDTTQAEYEAFKSDLKSLWLSFAANMRVNTGILGVNSFILLKEEGTLAKRATTVTGALARLNDPELKAIWEEAYVVEGERVSLYYQPFERFMAANNARMIKKGRALGDKLVE